MIAPLRCFLFLLVCASLTAPAQEEAAPAADPGTPTTAAEVGPGYGEMSYRLGPGDLLSIQLYGRPETIRPEVTVAPDGTLSFLSATEVPVQGLTISEAARAIEEALVTFYRQPRVLITPMQLVSKNYTVIGMVKLTGIFPMTQPVTLLEAIARAGGTVSGLFDRRYVDLADLDRSVLVRQGRRLPVNFRKLILEGDMSQNVDLAPGDTILIASALANDYFVLGAVRRPGREGFTSGASVMAGIAKRLGFTDSAYRERVLVVRGSMTDPQVFVVNTDAILKGDREDFPLEPKDIIYVSNRPWERAEQILDGAVSVFIESATAAWVGGSAPVLIRRALLPPLNREEDR